MARAMFNVIVPQRTPVANPETLVQIVAPAAQRVVLRSIRVIALGSTGATGRIPFDVCVQDTAGTSSDGAAYRYKNDPQAAETLQTAIRYLFTAEPPTSNPRYEFGLHEQQEILWVPDNAYKEIIIEGGTRLGLRYKRSTFVPVQVSVQLEE